MTKRRPRRRLGRGADCGGKRRYRDVVEASDALAAHRRSGRDRIAVRYYFCIRCEGYHLTSQERRS